MTTSTTEPAPDEVIGAGSAAYIVLRLVETESEWARGATKYGENGLFDTQRKIELDKQCVAIRQIAVETTAKVTETDISQRAHSHPPYVAFVAKAATEREVWLLLDAQRKRWYVTLDAIARGLRFLPDYVTVK